MVDERHFRAYNFNEMPDKEKDPSGFDYWRKSQIGGSVGVVSTEQYLPKVPIDFYDDDEDYDDDYDDDDYYQERREEELQERASNCTCGAWKMSKTGEVFHVADCCCGAE